MLAHDEHEFVCDASPKKLEGWRAWRGLAYDFAMEIASAGGGAFVAREEPDPTCGTKVPLR